MPHYPCDPVPYDKVSTDLLADKAAGLFTVEYDETGNAELVGECPQCHAEMRHTIVIEVYRQASSNSSPPPPVAYEPMFCNCTGDHQPRPAGTKGCGANWVLELGDE